MLTIGALARVTGIPVDTLRTWERRYGFPRPERRASGHRRYPVESVAVLRSVREALAQGHRASAVLGLPPESLAALIQASRAPQSPGNAWLDAAAAFDADALARGFNHAWESLGAAGFVFEAAVPFLREVGARWARGELSVAHEHHASERFRDFVTARWRAFAANAGGHPVVLASLPAEQHTLGLHLAAVLLALHGHRLSFLGADTPLVDISAAVGKVAAPALVVGSSLAASPRVVTEQLRTLREMLPEQAQVLVGGCPEAPAVPGVSWIPTLEQLEIRPASR